MNEEDCARDLVRSRDRGAVQALQQLEFLTKKARMLELESEMSRVQASIEAKQKSFRPHPIIDEFLSQFHPDKYGEQGRSLCLLLVGDSRQGKSTKAISLFSTANTLKVSCQGLPPGVLPSLQRFNRSKHRCIVWDEIRPDQVLNNRELFQSNQFEQVLSQSVCNQHSYGVWLYFTAMVLCANEFEFYSPRITSQDSAWLEVNIRVAQLGADQRWFLNV